MEGTVRLLGGRYELADRIGGGGMADVFRAHDRTLDRDVAVKVMRPQFATDPEFVERFHREAEALGAIDHPNIVRVVDYGAGADGRFIVMELVGGGTLRDLMRARGRVDQYAAAKIAAAIADGLEAAHLRGVLHRDLKPDNVLLDGEGRPKIADFGIARLAAATAITRTGELLGTPQYLAPEQMSGDVVDERADVYALGVILYEMLTGTQPTGGTTPSEIVSRRLRVDPRPPSRLVPLAPALSALVMRTLARDPARRPSRAADLRIALLAIAPPAPRVPAPARVIRLRWPSPAPLLAFLALVAAFVRGIAVRAHRLGNVRVALPVAWLPAMARVPVVRIRLPSSAPLVTALALIATSVRDHLREVGRRVAMVANKPLPPPATARIRVVRSRQRSPAPLLASFALLVAFVGGSLAFAVARPASVAPIALPTATPLATAAVLANSSSPEATPAPSVAPEPTAEPTPEPTTVPTVAPTLDPVANASGDPAGTIMAFYQLISGHDYASASGLWSDRMRASYPPQTNIWGRFDRTSSIVARSASLTSARPGSAAVAVDLIETLSDGTVRHWVGTWYLVRSGSGWLLDQPGLRAA
ncbi:MAG TPA: serine/threonine-protein kinase [Candidatus Limnocylindria bacterium]